MLHRLPLSDWSSSALNTGSASKRGRQHQTIRPIRSTSALNAQLPTTPQSSEDAAAAGVAVMAGVTDSAEVVVISNSFRQDPGRIHQLRTQRLWCGHPMSRHARFRAYLQAQSASLLHIRKAILVGRVVAGKERTTSDEWRFGQKIADGGGLGNVGRLGFDHHFPVQQQHAG